MLDSKLQVPDLPVDIQASLSRTMARAAASPGVAVELNLEVGAHLASISAEGAREKILEIRRCERASPELMSMRLD